MIFLNKKVIRIAKIYFDTGFFIDYLCARSVLAPKLRGTKRRGRTYIEIVKDAEDLSKKIVNHDAHTSILSFLEYSENSRRYLPTIVSGIYKANQIRKFAHKSDLWILSTFCRNTKIQIHQLDASLIPSVIQNSCYDNLFFKDSLHVENACQLKVDYIISCDKDMLKHDQSFNSIRIIETDEALSLL